MKKITERLLSTGLLIISIFLWIIAIYLTFRE